MNQEMNENKMVKKAKVESYDISRSDETMHLAIDLAKFIKENKLYQNIQGKEFVNVEGWQYAGSRLGIFPVVDHVVNVSTDAEMKYEAKVSLVNVRTNQTVGAGFAICSNKENGKKYYQEFAIASMAQTRAIGKAYRNILAWIIRAAGYEPTPVEEMDYTTQPEVKTVQKPVAKADKPAKAAASAPETPAAAVTMTASPAAPAEAAAATTTAAPITEGEAPNVKYATAKQKEEIIRLLNNVVITRQEKTKMLLNINKLDEERAAQSIQKLRKVIEEREDQAKAA
ncbi:hypothetical protein F0P94_09080 [Adhaeribacter soli]|uniref:Uncharacterized protein n=2 Tax=Adhaeribacter soli TaxID=2607655 RepID=A0A5N1J304_9BACT|nr:hypothetical protein F0P94_09080 [Adhaeribacter soli]